MAELVYPPVLMAARATFLGLGLTFQLSGTGHVPRRGGAVLAINHIGFLDFTFAGLAARPANRLVRFMAKDAVFRHPVSGPLMRGMKHIPVDRASGAAAFDTAVAALRAGEIVGVFPEATMSPSFELLPFKTGTVRMAKEAGVPVLPVVLWGSHRVASYGRRRKVNLERIPVSIDVGEPMPSTDGYAGALTRTLREQMQEMLHAAQDRYPVRPAPGEDPWWLPARMGGSAPTPEEALTQVAARRTGRTAG